MAEPTNKIITAETLGAYLRDNPGSIDSCEAPVAMNSADGSKHLTNSNGKVSIDTSKHNDVTITMRGEDGKSTGHLTATYQNGVSGSDRNFKPDAELANKIRIAATAAKACGDFNPAAKLMNDMAKPAELSNGKGGRE